MLESVKNITGYTIGATDGEIGAVEDFYFDDERWTVRYIVVDTGKWLPGRNVLISPIAFGKIDGDQKKINVSLSRQQVKDSPDIDTAKPVSRQNETSYAGYYGYPIYWAGPYLWGPAGYPGGIMAPSLTGAEASNLGIETEAERIKEERQRQSEDIHLRSVKEVSGYYIEAIDGDVGHVEDFVIDRENWSIRYLIIDTRNWLPGKHVLVAPNWVRDVSWSDQRVYIDMSRDQIKNSPEYDPAALLNRDYEERLHRHYGRPGYWQR